MAVKIRIPKEQIPDLNVIRTLGSESLRRVFNHLRQLPSLPLRFEELHESVADVLEGNAENAEALVRQLLALNQFIRQRVRTVDDVLDGMRSGIESLSEWSDEQKGDWKSIEPQLRDLIQADAVRTVSKAADLSYEHANIFQSCRILTDIRPIFKDCEDDELAIDGAVVSYTLRLHFDDSEGDHSLSIALDETDVLNLKKQCERALLKAQIACEKMIEMAQIPTIILGEAMNESN